MFKYVDEYRDAGLAREISEKIKKISSKPLVIMEVCGGHTMSIRKSGIHKLVGDNIELISGPGCPVCVTSIGDIDKAIALSRPENSAVCAFGDMMYVPGSSSSLARAKAAGSDVRMVYSPHDVLGFAENEPDKTFFFISIGFETTTPTTAAAILTAQAKGIKNFKVLSLNKTMPAALRAVLSGGDSRVGALLCPGHVSTITGTRMYDFIPADFGVPCCVSGFEPVDILSAIYILAEMNEKGEKGLVNAYPRAVQDTGNEKAKYIMNSVFEPSDAEWRGFGVIPASGLKIRAEYAAFDAEKGYIPSFPKAAENPACVCGDILRGSKNPDECQLFAKECTPSDPKGACMVSSEGTCAAWFRYGGR